MLRWGLLGTSFISETMAQAINADSGSTIQAVAGRRPEAVNSFCEKFPTQQTYHDYHALINDPTVDIVYIGLPNHLHHEYAIACAKAGKHALCEKSLSIDMQKTQAIVDAVSQSQIFFVEGLMYLHHPLLQKYVELLNDNVIGNVRTVSGQYCADIAQFVNRDGAGAIFNLGCYPASLLHLTVQTVFGSDIWSSFDLKAFGSISDKDGNICETAMTLALPNGVTAQLHTAETFGMFSEFVVVGEMGSLRFLSNPWLPEKDGNVIEITPFDGDAQRIEIMADGDAFYYQVKQIREALEQGKRIIGRPIPSLQDSFEIMQILTKWHDAARLSS